MTKTFEDVIEAHRLAVGAGSVHVTLGPEATPEKLEESFARVRKDAAAYNAFSVEERQEAFIARLRGTLGKIDHLARQKDHDGILRLTDMIVDADFVEDTRFLAKAREKRGLPLPDGVAEVLARYDARDNERDAA